MGKEIKIKTPYGVKNWSFVKRVFDTHDALVFALETVVDRESSLDGESRNYHDNRISEWRKLAIKARGL